MNAVFYRRQFLLVGSMLIAATSAHAVMTDVVMQKATLPRQRVMALYRDKLPLSRQFALLSQLAGLPTMALTMDPVRQWRDGLGSLLIDDGWRLAGISNWIDYMVLRGLAAEARRFPLLELQHDENQLQQHGLDSLMAALLTFAQEADNQELARQHALLMEYSSNINPRSGLFSWVI